MLQSAIWYSSSMVSCVYWNIPIHYWIPMKSSAAFGIKIQLWVKDCCLQFLSAGCGNLPPPTGGRYIKEADGWVRLKCNKGYRRVGPMRRQCRNGAWTDASLNRCFRTYTSQQSFGIGKFYLHNFSQPFASSLLLSTTLALYHSHPMVESIDCFVQHIFLMMTVILLSTWNNKCINFSLMWSQLPWPIRLQY